MYQIAICDDVKEYSEELKGTLLSTGLKESEVEFFDFSSGEAFLTHLKNEKATFDLVFMDMQMDGISGFEAAMAFRQQNPDAVLVFCSGTEAPTERTFEASPFRYLLKSYNRDKMRYELMPILEEMKKRKKDITIVAKYNSMNIVLSIKDILYVEKRKRGCRIYLRKSCKSYNPNFEITTEKHLDDLLEQLRERGFAKPHSSYMVNLEHLKLNQIKEGRVWLEDEIEISITRLKEKEFKSEFTKYIGSKY